MPDFSYRCKARSVDAFLSQLIRYISSGHYFYITGRVPDRKDPAAVDAKLIALYDIAKPRWARARRRLRGTAGIHYLRHDRFFALMATHGQHQFFDDHAQSFRDIRRNALHFAGYSIRYTYSEREKRWKVFVRLDRNTYRNLRAQMLDIAVRPSYRPTTVLEEVFNRLNWQPYEPVRRQLLTIINAVNRRRRYARYPSLDASCLPKMRRVGDVYRDCETRP